MRNTLLLLACILLSIPAGAQRKDGFDPDLARNAIRAEYGALVPFGTMPNNSAGFFSLSYTHRSAGHWGWRGGLQYAPIGTPTKDYVGLPLAVVYRASASTFNSRQQEYWDDDFGRDRMKKDIFADVLSAFFRRTEIFAGVTPGYLLGDESNRKSVHGVAWSDDGRSIWTEAGLQLDNRFSLSADAGVTFSIPIWRLSLDITPAFHGLLTNSVSEHRQNIDPKNNQPVGDPSVKPIRWMFTLSGGLSFLF
jgi:hypothetical protein